MIALEQVSKSYSQGKVKAVKELTLQVPPGEIFGFLGPNGAGKSTTIKMLVGLLKPDSGTVSLQGCNIQRDPLEVKKRVGYVPDEPILYEKMTGRRYLNFICDVFLVSKEKRDERIALLSQEFTMDQVLDDTILSYSHGMKQKIQIIAALVHDPEVFILDEPMTGLDPRASFTLKDIMRRLCNDGKTVFFSTHVMEVAERICDSVGIIRKGELIAHAPFPELKAASGKQDSTLEQLFLELTHEQDMAAD